MTGRRRGPRGAPSDSSDRVESDVARPEAHVMGSAPADAGQIAMPPGRASRARPRRSVGVTFHDSRAAPIHRWYPYVEGFSAAYVAGALDRYATRGDVIYDPFGGTGTTLIEASYRGMPSIYSEINPAMAFIADAKTTGAAWAQKNKDTFAYLVGRYREQLTSEQLDEVGATVSLDHYEAAFRGREFFEEVHLRRLLAAKALAGETAADVPDVHRLLLLACAANVVHSSNMTRRADLRYRRSNEYKTRVVDVAGLVRGVVDQMVADLGAAPRLAAATRLVSEDCRELPAAVHGTAALALTSPPYVNGTNYFRNTKLELWFLDLINSEDDLGWFRRASIAAGINNVSADRVVENRFEEVEAVASKLDECSPDRRIPQLVRLYFSDMSAMFAGVGKALRSDGRFVLDIGDSRFYGVHVPADELLVRVAADAGFVLETRSTLARRVSRDKSPLVQVELVFRRRTASVHKKAVGDPRIAAFQRDFPHRQPPYNSKSWGDPLHSLCSYHGKLRPSLAHWLVREFTSPGDAVLDPLGGVGTVAFEAALQGRTGISNDKSPFPALVASAKLNPPTLEEALSAVEWLAGEIDAVGAPDRAAAEFGLNARVADYFHPNTLDEILAARGVFARRDRDDPATRLVWASLLHVLHGNRPYALSRTSHPLTPYSPRGDFVYKRVTDHVRRRIERVLSPAGPPQGFVPGTGLNGDFRDLPALFGRAFDSVITSPPFLGMRFDRPNWMRLWFTGWGADDFHNTSASFLERQQASSRACYVDFFEAMRALLKPGGLLVLHLGSGGRGDLVGDLRVLGGEEFDLVGEVVEPVTDIERHGIRDKGRTTAHHLLFFR